MEQLPAVRPLINSENAPSAEDYRRFRNQQIAKGVIAGGLAVATGAFTFVAIKWDYGLAYNSLITTAAGVVLGGAILLIPYRTKLNAREVTKLDLTLIGTIIDFTKDKIINYAATFFIVVTQIYLNVGQPKWATRLVYGGFNAILGIQLATIVDNLFHMKLKDDRSEGVDLEEEDPRKIEMLYGNAPGTRRSIEVVKVTIAIAAIILGYYYAPATVATKLGMILLGNSVGIAFHETIHGIKKHLEKKHQAASEIESPFVPPSATMPTSIKVLIVIEKTEQVFGLFFPGFAISFNTSATDFLSGMFYGMLRQFDWIRMTKTPLKDLDELKRVAPDEQYHRLNQVMTVVKWIFSIVVVGGFLIYGIEQGIAKGPHVDAYALSTVIGVLYGSYFLSRFMDRQTLPSNRLYNTLFFLTHYSLSPPLLFYAITQVLKIGDIALKDYGPYKIVLSCIAYASLAFSFGTEAGRRATDRAIPYPAQVNPLIMLYTAFLAQQLRGIE
ncbi:MAG: hypothetical protein H7A41_00975 [Chlamydiales bacterium]|nr:hypothetical protein [Chlamydiales bacterium]